MQETLCLLSTCIQFSMFYMYLANSSLSEVKIYLFILFPSHSSTETWPAFLVEVHGGRLSCEDLLYYTVANHTLAVVILASQHNILDSCPLFGCHCNNTKTPLYCTVIVLFVFLTMYKSLK